MFVKKFAKKTQAQLFKKDPKADPLPQRAQERFNQIDHLSHTIRGLLDEHETYYRTANAYHASSQRLSRLIGGFVQQQDVQDMTDGEADIFSAVADRLTSINVAFIQAAVPPFLQTLQQCVDVDLERIAIQRETVFASFQELSVIQTKFNNLIESESKNSNKLRSVKDERANNANAFELEERKLERLHMDLEAKLMFSNLNALCAMMNAQHSQANEAHNILSDAEPILRHIDTVITQKQQDFVEARDLRLKELHRLDELNKMSQDIMNESVFEATIANCELPAEPPRIGGEGIILKMERVVNVDEDQAVSGVLYMTNYKLSFQPYKNPQNPLNEHQAFSIPLMSISQLENVGGPQGLICFGCKDLQTYTISFRHCVMEVSKVFACMEPFVFSSNNIFAFYYRPDFHPEVNGWDVYDPIQEYGRMGIPNAKWRLTNANSEYELCPTYPSVLAVPNSTAVSDEELKKCASFRSKRRLPVLCWKQPGGRKAIFRSSQPKVGMKRGRSFKDEFLIQMFGHLTMQHMQDPSVNMCIVDARPKVNAYGNVAKGGGFENTSNYTNCEFVFLGIPNIHVVRESLQKLRQKFSCLPKMTTEDVHGASQSEWERRYGSIERSYQDGSGGSWLKHISLILKGAVQVVKMITERECSVLVHCSDGWDRTSQISSLAQLFMDPYYRTLEGFATLIEKEWCSFGHKFARRIGHGKQRSNFLDSQRSPIFLQFLDTIYQVTNQFPTHFEFNDALLIHLADNLFSCKYGTFLENSEQMRRAQGTQETTVSVWTSVLHFREAFTNPSYTLSDDILFPRCIPNLLQLWLPFFVRWDTSHPRNISNRSSMMERSSQSQTSTPILSPLGSPPPEDQYGGSQSPSMLEEYPNHLSPEYAYQESYPEIGQMQGDSFPPSENYEQAPNAYEQLSYEEGYGECEIGEPPVQEPPAPPPAFAHSRHKSYQPQYEQHQQQGYEQYEQQFASQQGFHEHSHSIPELNPHEDSGVPRRRHSVRESGSVQPPPPPKRHYRHNSDFSASVPNIRRGQPPPPPNVDQMRNG